MDYAVAIDFLYNLAHGAVKLGLERITRALELRDQPQRRYATVHVAGTNGKGSTCAFIAAILEAAGLRSGLLTSPHLRDYCERIRIGGVMVAPHEVAALTEELQPLIRETELSYFEATTLLAFEAFARARVDVAVIEVGMGGRLDATNLVHPELAVITGISLDHTKSLGATAEEIAGEKAGIMKPRIPVLVGRCSPAVRDVFARRGAELQAPVHALEDRVRLLAVEPVGRETSYCWQREDAPATTGHQQITLAGEHQANNALLAAESARLLAAGGLPISADAISHGLSTARWPGRFEIIPPRRGMPTVILDVAHNTEGAASLVATYRRWLADAGDPELVVGMLGDKSHADFLRALRPLTDHLHLIPLDSPRAGPLAQLADAARAAGFAPQVWDGMARACEILRQQTQPVLITGSFLTVEAAMLCLDLPPLANLFSVAARDRDRSASAPVGRG